MTIYLSENIKRLRREKELTQETLAEFFSVTFQSVSKWEAMFIKRQSTAKQCAKE